jgi:cell division protein FtsQ
VRLSRSTGEFKLVRPRGDAIGTSVRRLRRRLRPGRSDGPARRISPGALLLALLAVIVIGACTWVLLGTSVLGVRQVRVTGTSLVPESEVLAAAGVAPGTPLARVDTGAVAARVDALPPVASAEVSRSWPGTLVIAVTERVAVATVAGPAGFGVLDAGGFVFRTVPQRPAGVPLLEVSTPGPSDPNTRAALRVLAALTPQLREQLTSVSAATPSQVRLALAGGRVVIWGDTEQSDLKARVATTLLGRPGKTIDVSAPDVATTSS